MTGMGHAITPVSGLVGLATIAIASTARGHNHKGAVVEGVDGAGELRILAVGRTLEWIDLDRVARRDELLIEIGGDAVNELQRSDLEYLVFRSCLLRPRNGHCCEDNGYGEPGGSQEDGEHENLIRLAHARPHAEV